MITNTASINDFHKLDIRVGKIIEVNDFPEARKPAYKLTIDFGPTIGIKKSSVQITENYTKEELINTLVISIINFPPRQIGPFISEVLTLGVPTEENTAILVRPDWNVPLGGKLY
jgi:tRNA-binding protein